MSSQAQSELEREKLLEQLAEKTAPLFPSPVLPLVVLRKQQKSHDEINTDAEEAEISIRAPPAMSVGEFCKIFGIGRSVFYEEVNSGRLKLRKIGNRSIIAGPDFIEYMQNLSLYVPKEQRDEGEVK